MLHRLGRYLILILIAIDQFFQVILSGPNFILVGEQEPNPDETISSVVGRSAVAGERWALWVAEPVINAVMFALTGKNDHCRRCIGH